MAILALGGGHTRPGDVVDHGVGLTDVLPIGTAVKAGDTLALVHARTREAGEAAAASIGAATQVGEAPTPRPVILERIRPVRPMATGTG